MKITEAQWEFIGRLSAVMIGALAFTALTEPPEWAQWMFTVMLTEWIIRRRYVP
jgi:hypothetical protein